MQLSTGERNRKKRKREKTRQKARLVEWTKERKQFYLPKETRESVEEEG